MKRPAFQFYPADWRKDAALQSCSLAAQGLWVNLLCIAHECEPYGHLTVNGKAMTSSQVARLVGTSEKECSRLLAELAEAGVTSRTADGTVYSRRMVRDEGLRNVRSEGGKAGSEFGILGKAFGAKGGRPRKDTGDKKPPLKPPPSSSSSSSEEIHTVAKPEGEALATRSPPPGRGTRLPKEWAPSEAQIAYCRGQRPDLEPQRVWIDFRDYWTSKSGKDATKVDWNAAWQMWVRRERQGHGRTGQREKFNLGQWQREQARRIAAEEAAGAAGPIQGNLRDDVRSEGEERGGGAGVDGRILEGDFQLD